MSTSDKVGGIASLVIAIVITILTLWFGKVTKKKPTPNPGTAPIGPVNFSAAQQPAAPAAAIPAPAAARQQLTAAGGNALPAAVINGASAPVQAPAKVSEPEPTPSYTASVIRTLDDETIII